MVVTVTGGRDIVSVVVTVTVIISPCVGTGTSTVTVTGSPGSAMNAAPRRVNGIVCGGILMTRSSVRTTSLGTRTTRTPPGKRMTRPRIRFVTSRVVVSVELSTTVWGCGATYSVAADFPTRTPPVAIRTRFRTNGMWGRGLVNSSRI